MDDKGNKMEPDNKLTPKRTWPKRLAAISYVQLSILLLAIAYTLYFVRPVLLPIILALLLSLILKPVHRQLCKLRLPAPLSSILIILAMFGLFGVGLFYLSAPTVEYADKLRNEIVKNRLKNVFHPITRIQKEISDVATEVERITNTGESKASNESLRENKSGTDTPTTNDSKQPGEDNQRPPSGRKGEPSEPSPPVKVSVTSNPVDELLEVVQAIGFYLVITLAMVYFLLAYGEKMLNRITEVKITARLIDEVTDEVSSYMFTITIINVGLGMVVSLSMWLLGMPNPILWGVLATVLNFIPYIGAIIGTGIVFLVAATHYDQNLYILLVPAVYFLATIIEGHIVTPAVLGKRFTVNPIIIFVWVLCWGALWGIPGMLIGLPLLMTCRITLSRWPGFNRIERVIST